MRFESITLVCSRDGGTLNCLRYPFEQEAHALPHFWWSFRTVQALINEQK
eukprot:m.329581 g.329581  ORF g.329581 m.329581 type:complete len:50 (+) comp16038_c0_seq2:3932-4081(+)